MRAHPIAAGLLLAVGLAAQEPRELPTPEWVPPPPLEAASADGSFGLAWQPIEAPAGGSISFDLEETTPQGERNVLDAGPFAGAALSGREDGTYTYRVRARAADGATGDWSAAFAVHVRHHSLALAIALFAIGAVVFVATAVTVIGGARRASAEASR